MGDKAQKLKDQGNALFAKKQFSQAFDKYSAAIKLDPRNAVLYANRSACSLGMKKYMDAAGDAENSTQLDPTYAKGWARLATARQKMGQWSLSMTAWKSALVALPQSNLSPIEAQQKLQYTAGVEECEKAMEDKRRKRSDPVMGMRAGGPQDGNMPWDKAAAICQQLTMEGKKDARTSAWVIYGAFKAFQEGVERMNRIWDAKEAEGSVPSGQPSALEPLLDAIFRDQRVFHIRRDHRSGTWLEKFDAAVSRELEESCTDWPCNEPHRIVETAVARLPSEGWAKVRPALSSIVHVYILRGFLENGLAQNKDGAINHYDAALNVLEEGSELWQDVSPEDRGHIFDPRFVHGVHLLKIKSYMDGVNHGGRGYDKEGLMEMAEYLLADTKSEQPAPPNEDLGSFFSFSVYPAGEAMMVLGLCEMKNAASLNDKHEEERQQHLERAATQFIAAADVFPEDEEKAHYCLISAIEAFFSLGRPLRDTMPVIARLRSMLPKMDAIWRHSQMSQGGQHEKSDRMLWFEGEMRHALEAGQITLQDSAILGKGREVRMKKAVS